MMRSKPIFRAVVIGESAGGSEALAEILPVLPDDFALSLFVVQHLYPSDYGSFAGRLALLTRLAVIEPCDKERIESGHVYTAPADYHMLVEINGTISLSVDEKVNWSRPSIDVLFESAAIAYKEALIAILLSGASADGAKGMSAVKAAGGLTIAQDPTDARYPVMPLSAINSGAVNEVLKAKDIGRRLIELTTADLGLPVE